MIYLIMKMFVYLAVALLAGFGAGWLTRNLMAAKKEDELHRTVSETKSRMPQFESLMRTRDEQMKTLRQELKDKDARIGELHEEMDAQDKTLKEKDRELKSANNRLASFDVDDEAGSAAAGADTELSEVDMSGGAPLDYSEDYSEDYAQDYSGVDSDGTAGADLATEVRRLEGEVERLRQHEQGLQAELRIARSASDSATTASSTSAMEEVLRTEVQELESRLRQTAQEHDRLAKALEQEKRKVVELERERDLQNRSLQVLHQQLELARENGGQAASG